MKSAFAATLLLLTACSQPETPQESESTPTTFGVGRQYLSDGVLVGETLYANGLIGADPVAPIEDQTTSAMQRLGSLLESAGMGYSNVVSCHVQLSDMENYSAMNAVYGGFFEEGSYPARTTLEYPALPGGAGVMVTCTAYADSEAIEVIRPPSDVIPPAMGPYSSAVRAGNTVYLSGQGGRDPKTGELAESAGAQAKKTLETIGHILEAAGLGYQHTAFASSYSPTGVDHGEVDAAFLEIFDAGGAPSRARVGLSRLPGDISTEITFVAVNDNYITRLFMHDEKPTALLSPASLAGDVLYASAVSGEGTDFGAQFDAIKEQHREMLALGGMSLDNVVSVRAYLASLDHSGALAAELGEAFPDGIATTTLQAELSADSLVELELIAVR